METKLRSWHIALMAVLIALVGDLYSLAMFYNECQNNSECFQNVIHGYFMIYAFGLYVALIVMFLIRFKKTRKIGATLSILAGLFFLFINFYSATFSFLYFTALATLGFQDVIGFLYSILLLSAGLFFFFKENKGKLNSI